MIPLHKLHTTNIKVFGHLFHEKLRNEHGNKDFENVCCAAHVLNLVVSVDLKKVFQANGRPFPYLIWTY
ncbi:4727_t:CDS:2 [Dentiscutata erythropus]|uniref:4727_t:CDS:1 n=1 Tax=Dentiscutata erythropus TaxID=1348616 RepID=A0A9N8Z811_9GLOM|nr:4727_t:CDS:2 [Dentiscutata erythropus]